MGGGWGGEIRRLRCLDMDAHANVLRTGSNKKNGSKEGGEGRGWGGVGWGGGGRYTGVSATTTATAATATLSFAMKPWSSAQKTLVLAADSVSQY